MTRTLVMPDTEGATQTWLRAKPGITNVVGERVFFGMPTKTVYPLITARLIGGGPLPGYAFIVQGLLQFDCWAEGRKKKQAADTMCALVDVLQLATVGEQMDDEHTLFESTFQTPIFLPDPTTAQARYIVTAAISTKRIRDI